MITHPHVKINLGLSVLRKRPDGYHDLETLFVPYHGLSDTLEIIAGEDWSETSASLFARYSPDETAQAIAPDGSLMVTIARRGGVDWDPLHDLTARAYFLLRDEGFKLPPMKIFLEKTSPVGAGLGGGSSDAAFALRMISKLAGLGLPDAELAGFAARLGSDCAFFVYDRPMLGEGRGEILTPYELDISDYELRVVVPEGISVSTAEAYRGIRPRLFPAPEACSLQEAELNPGGECFPQGAGPRGCGVQPSNGRTEAVRQVADASRNFVPLGNAAVSDLPDRREQMPLQEALARPVEQWRDCLVNDFETTVFAAHPALATFKQRLYDEGAVYASMSGSGSALFGLFAKKQ